MRRALTLAINDKRDLSKVPAKYKGLVGQEQIGRILIMLNGDRDDVLTSKDIEKIVIRSKFKEGMRYTWLVPNVTIEGERMILTSGQYLLRISNFYWTDEGYSQRKQSMHEFIVDRRQQLFDERQNIDSE